MVRVLGAAMQLGTNAAPLNLHLYRGAATLAQIGLSLILFAWLQLLVQIRNGVHRRRQTIVLPCAVYVLAALLGVAFILGIVGATSVPDSDFQGFTTTQVPSTLVAGAVVYVISFLLLCLYTITLWFYVKCIESTEKRLFVAATASLPFLLVRVVYGALCMILDNMQFHWFKGCLLMFILMDLVMETLAVTIYETAGLATGCQILRRTARTGSNALSKSENDINLSVSSKGSRAGLISAREP